MGYRAVLSLAALAACAGSNVPGYSNAWKERVATHDGCLDIGHCRNFAPFWRVGSDPTIGNVEWVVSDAGHACVVKPFDNWQFGELWDCKWRMARG